MAQQHLHVFSRWRPFLNSTNYIQEWADREVRAARLQVSVKERYRDRDQESPKPRLDFDLLTYTDECLHFACILSLFFLSQNTFFTYFCGHSWKAGCFASCARIFNKFPSEFFCKFSEKFSVIFFLEASFDFW